MSLNSHQLQRFGRAAPKAPGPSEGDLPRPPAEMDVLLIGAGNSGEAVTLRCQGLAYTDGLWLNAAGLNNDRLPPRPVPVRCADGSAAPLELSGRLVLDGENPRERIADYPLLERRYRPLLRGLAVFETYPRAGAGGHGHPVISALDIDLAIDALLGWLRGELRKLYETPAAEAGQTELQRLIAARRRRDDVAREKRIIVVGGACGAMGNATHQLLPYLIRQQLAERGMAGCELWGVLLGPRSYCGLTPFVRHNYRAALEAIEFLSRNGQRRDYINDLSIASQQPPYDRVFLLDDPTLPGAGASVSEAEMERFLDQAALSLYLALRGTVWQTIASHIANDDGVARADGRLRYLHTLRGVAMRADRDQLTELLSAHLSAAVLDRFVDRFGA